MTPTVLARGTYDAFKVKSPHDSPVNFKAKAKSPVDFVVRRHDYAIGAYTGWHTHPGPVFITVTQGELTYYHYGDPTCTPHVVTAGHGLVDNGSGPHRAERVGRPRAGRERDHALRWEEPSAASSTRRIRTAVPDPLGHRECRGADRGRLPGYRRHMDVDLVEQTLADLGEPAYRARQVWEWTARGAESYDVITTLPKPLRATLAETVPFSTLELLTERESRDGTVKALFQTADGHPVETVLMRYRDGRRSLCLSSQSGCPLTCTFCATGAMRFGRNLTESEILDQALHFRRREPVNHAVYMGMGEPLMNVDAVLASARRLPDLGITHRRTTISTVGWMPGLRRFVDEVEQPIRLALSIHAADPEKRSQLMPVNDRYALADVLAECRRYVQLRRRKVFVEYVMLAGVNDSSGGCTTARRAPRARRVQGQPDPLQPHGPVRRLLAAGGRGLQGRARPRPHPRDRPSHEGAGHRSSVRSARRLPS